MKNLDQAYMKFSEMGVIAIDPFCSNSNSKEILIQDILALHIDKIDQISTLLTKQACTYNELFIFLAQYPNELKFCKQLFIHREDLEVNMVFLYTVNAFKPFVFPLIIDHFNLANDEEHYDAKWMTFIEAYCSELDVNSLSANDLYLLSEETGKILIKLNKF